MLEFRRFSKSDWMGFSGAEKLLDGSDPFIGEIEVDGKEGVVIVTDLGIEIYVENTWYNLPLELQSSSAAVLLRLNPQMTEAELQSFGFKILVC